MSGSGLPVHPKPAGLDYQSLVAGWADMNTVATMDGVYRYVSPSSQRLFAWAPSELVGRCQDEVVHPDDVASLQAARADLASGKVHAATYRFKCGDGSYRWTERRPAGSRPMAQSWSCHPCATSATGGSRCWPCSTRRPRIRSPASPTAPC